MDWWNTMFLRGIFKIWAFILLGAMLGCAKGKVFEDDDQVEKKPARTAAPHSGDSGGRQLIFEAFYDFKAYKGKDYDETAQAPTDSPLCDGEAKLVGYSDFSTVATGISKCKGIGVKDIDLGKFMDGALKTLPIEEMLRQGADTRVVRITEDGPATFVPFKPYLVGPLIQRSSDYENLDITDSLTATFKTEDGNQSSGSGTVRTRVLAHSMEYKPRLHPTTFKEVMHWGMYAEGFDGIRKHRGNAKLYDIYEYHVAKRPLAILRFHIRSNVRHFEKGLAGIGGQILFNDIVIDLDLKEFVPVSE